jgi:hypothetical protein
MLGKQLRMIVFPEKELRVSVSRLEFVRWKSLIDAPCAIRSPEVLHGVPFRVIVAIFFSVTFGL